MKKFLIFILGLSMVFATTTTAFAVEGNQEAIKKEVVQSEKKKNVPEVIDEVNQSVVAVIGKNTKVKEREHIFAKFPKNLQHGSGVIVSKEGRIITNNHVVDGLKNIYVVMYDGKVYKAQLLYTDKEIDLALLKINKDNLKPMKMADEQKIKVGNEVIAIGTPLSFGYRNSATKGIVSGLNRPVDRMYTYLQTDAAINPGNSGGPLVNMKGELVGINTLGTMFFQGMNFSIPIDHVKYFIEQFDKYGKIRRCYTGIDFEENWAAMLGIPTNQGLKVVALEKGAVVNLNQVKEGDMLEAIDGKAITSIAQYNEILKEHVPEDKVKFTFSRKDKKIDVEVMLKEKQDKSKEAGKED
ncbi:trypsin-like peptidase domain-containing protein [Clostridium aestuarii]|uniref:Trypsin-like peptidase domain-containing protein n=1 Tax=Clostridium aestuarii TaxID=338193 RepID=A0ABT4D3M0_9CLOT|nr:trypsin-like peptidase domain-containing protein [Clostridium aestuarii]MCY6485242.1 trypsin-like peptidase domain-containing protein [Clostridium aestuarii]